MRKLLKNFLITITLVFSCFICSDVNAQEFGNLYLNELAIKHIGSNHVYDGVVLTPGLYNIRFELPEGYENHNYILVVGNDNHYDGHSISFRLMTSKCPIKLKDQSVVNEPIPRVKMDLSDNCTFETFTYSSNLTLQKLLDNSSSLKVKSNQWSNPSILVDSVATELRSDPPKGSSLGSYYDYLYYWYSSKIDLTGSGVESRFSGAIAYKGIEDNTANGEWTINQINSPTFNINQSINTTDLDYVEIIYDLSTMPSDINKRIDSKFDIYTQDQTVFNIPYWVSTSPSGDVNQHVYFERMGYRYIDDDWMSLSSQWQHKTVIDVHDLSTILNINYSATVNLTLNLIYSDGSYKNHYETIDLTGKYGVIFVPWILNNPTKVTNIKTPFYLTGKSMSVYRQERDVDWADTRNFVAGDINNSELLFERHEFNNDIIAPSFGMLVRSVATELSIINENYTYVTDVAVVKFDTRFFEYCVLDYVGDICILTNPNNGQTYEVGSGAAGIKEMDNYFYQVKQFISSLGDTTTFLHELWYNFVAIIHPTIFLFITSMFIFLLIATVMILGGYQ